MISIDTQRLLAQLFSTVALLEESIESHRCSLAQQSDFTPSVVFSLLDRHKLGRIDYSDLANYLRTNRIHASQQEIHALVAQFDGNEDGRLSREEFAQMVLPASNTALREEVLDRGPLSTSSREIAASFNELLRGEVNFHRESETQKKALASRNDYSPLSAFRAVDAANSGLIDRKTLKDFLMNFHLEATDRNVDALLRRWDCDGDEQLTYREFSEALALPAAPERLLTKAHLETEPPEPSPKTTSIRSAKSPVAKGAHGSSLFGLPTRYTVTEPSARTSTATPQQTTKLRISQPTPKSGLRITKKWKSASSLQLFLSDRQATEAENSALALMFKEQIANIKDLEQLKYDVAICEDFTIEDAFLIFVSDDSVTFSHTDVERVMRNWRVHVYADDARLLVSRYAGSECMNFKSFLRMVSTSDETARKELARKQPRNLRGVHRKYAFSTVTKNKFLTLMRMFLHIEHRHEVMRQNFQRIPKCHAMVLFSILDERKTGFWSGEEMWDFLMRNGIQVRRSDAGLVVRTFDQDGDGKVSAKEFVEWIAPHSRYEYF